MKGIAVSGLSMLVTAFSVTAQGSSNPERPSVKVEVEVPVGYGGKENLFFDLCQQRTTQLRLPSMPNGSDSIQIRIWYEPALMNGRELVMLTCSNAKWEGEVLGMTVDWDYKAMSETVKTVRRSDKDPVHGWVELASQLVQLEIMTLPHMDAIPGLEDRWTDGISYSVEIATTNHYRFYQYHLPDKFQDQFWQARNMVKILQLIEGELGIESWID